MRVSASDLPIMINFVGRPRQNYNTACATIANNTGWYMWYLISLYYIVKQSSVNSNVLYLLIDILGTKDYYVE